MIYEEPKCNLFTHHDITLTAFPLCCRQLSVQPTSLQKDQYQKGNYAVVGTFAQEIEIWNLDVLDAIEPALILGGIEINNKKGPKSYQQKQKLKPGSHEDAVLCIDLHTSRKELFASGSADNTVKIWDLEKAKCAMTYDMHTNKVRSCGMV